MKIVENKPAKRNDDALVQRLYIAAPCDVPWDSMEGDDRTRFCGQCQLNVYNIAAMSTKEAAALVRQNEGRLCLRLYQRKDGTIITDNCPVGLRKIRDRIKRCALAVLTTLAWFGLISAARAQGLLGAPIDPRYGVSGEVGPLNIVEPGQGSLLLTISSWVSSVLLCLTTFLKRGRIALLGALLLGVWLLTGIALGFGYASNYQHMSLCDQDFVAFLFVGGSLILVTLVAGDRMRRLGR